MVKKIIIIGVSILMSQVALAGDSHHGHHAGHDKKSVQAVSGNVMEVSVTKKGFEPARIETKAGEKLTLNITRKAKVTCATEISIPSLKIKKELPLNKTVKVELTPKAKGEVIFGCGMSQMVGGVILVK